MSVENVEKKATETRFLANMSHEIRTPMNSIMGFIELVLEDSLNTILRAEQLLEVKYHQGSHLLKVSTQISKIHQN